MMDERSGGQPHRMISVATFSLLMAAAALLLFLNDGSSNAMMKQTAISQQQRRDLEAKTKVLVIGAGAAGLTAARTLENQGGFDVLIIEASNRIGGRVRKNDDFADYPFDMGGTFIKDKDLLEEIKGTSVDIETDSGGTTVFIENDGSKRVGSSYGWHQFVDYTWYDFFADHIAPSDPDNIVFRCKVDTVDYRGSQVKVSCDDDRVYTADYAIVTVPLSILKRDDIRFRPSLPGSITNHRASMMPGLKLIMEFSETWYPDYFHWEIKYDDNGFILNENYFWDYSKFQDSDKHILAGYLCGEDYEYVRGLSESQVVLEVLDWLDDIFDGKASKTFKDYTLIDWTKDPLFRGVYTNRNPRRKGPKNVDDKVFVAGEAFPPSGTEHGWVHSAAFSGRDAAEKIINLAR